MNFYNFENEYYEKGYKNICGIDEVGRGCLFGDVVSCAIIMPKDDFIEGVNDSKKLSPKKREELYPKILESCLAVGIGRANPDIIDKVNIKMATHISMINALENLRDKEGKKVSADCVLIDAETIETGIFQKAIIKGDESCYSIACASIIQRSIGIIFATSGQKNILTTASKSTRAMPQSITERHLRLMVQQ